MIEITICYRDEGGFAVVEVDEDGIDFVDGNAYFNVEGKMECMKIAAHRIMYIKDLKQ